MATFKQTENRVLATIFCNLFARRSIAKDFVNGLAGAVSLFACLRMTVYTLKTFVAAVLTRARHGLTDERDVLIFIVIALVFVYLYLYMHV